jgi:hypothetical protein
VNSGDSMRFGNGEIYVLSALSQFGRLLSYFALAILLVDIAGSFAVAYALVAQSLPAILASTVLFRLVPRQSSVRTMIAAHLIVSGLLVWLIASVSLRNIFVFLILRSVIGAYIQPATQSLIVAWVRTFEVRRVRIRMNSVGAASTAIAPAVGGFIAAREGLLTLLSIDAACQIMAIFLYLQIDRRCRASNVIRLNDSPPSNEATVDQTIRLYHPAIRHHVTVWLALLVAGAVLNSVEFAVFERARLPNLEVGLVLAGWGVGGCIAFLLAAREGSQHRVRSLACVMCSSFCVIAVSYRWPLLSASLLAAGMANSMLTGTLQTAIQHAIPAEADDRMVWAKLHRAMAAINLAIAGSFGLLLSSRLNKSVVILALPLASLLLAARTMSYSPAISNGRPRAER